MRKYIRLLCIIFIAIYTFSSSAASIVNPGFESGTAPWIFYTNGAGSFINDKSGSMSSYAGHITISQPGTNVQLYQAGQVLEPNALYKLSFKAYSNTGHDLSVSIIKHGSPYTNYGLSKVVNLGTSWSEYSIQFTTSRFSGTINDGRLMFWLAPYDASGDQYYFDDVTLTKVSTSIPPTISTQPSSKTVSVGQTATFSVAAAGTAPLTYQWQKNGSNIPGATGATYTTPATTSADNGARFRIMVSNLYGKVTSNEATLTISPAPSPSGKQLILLDVTYTHNTTTKAFTHLPLPTSIPSNLVSPTNFAKGTLYQRVQVITKPSTKSVYYQMCVFQDALVASKHACSNGLRFTSPGTYYASQPMTSLYQYYNLDWSRRLLSEMLVVKDINGVPVDDRYGYAGKWSGSNNFGLYYPMKVRYTAVIVPIGGGAPVWP